MKVATWPVVELDGPVTIPDPVPLRASDEVTLVAVAAIGTWPVVIPDKPAFKHPAVVAPPLESVQSVAATPETVPALRIEVSVPCIALDEVTVVALAAIGTWLTVIPESPLPPTPVHPEVVNAPPVPLGQIGLVPAVIVPGSAMPFGPSVIAIVPGLTCVPDEPAAPMYQLQVPGVPDPVLRPQLNPNGDQPGTLPAF